MKTKKLHIWKNVTSAIVTFTGCALGATLENEKYSYDSTGNIIAKNVDGQLTQFNFVNNILKTNSQGVTYVHDEAGRLVGEYQGDHNVRKLTYHFGDKVTQIKKEGSTVNFYYNAEGQLVGSVNNGEHETFAWDGLGLAMRGNQSYVNEEHIVGESPILVGEDVAVCDIVGNTLCIGSSLMISTAYGEGLEKGFFTGKPFVKELEGFVFKYRNYSAKQLRWISADPTGYPDGLNNYQYAMANPISYVDPLGLDVVWGQTTKTAKYGTNPLGTGAFGLTTPNASISQNGEHQVNEVGECFQPAFHLAQEYSGTMEIDYVGIGAVVGSGQTDAVFSAQVLLHEGWHESHVKASATKTLGSFQTWWNNYSGNEFGLESEAEAAGTNDLANGHAKAIADSITLVNRSKNHEGLTTPDAYTIESGGLYYWRSQNPDWGQSLLDSIDLHTIQFQKIAGTCEE